MQLDSDGAVLDALDRVFGKEPRPPAFTLANDEDLDCLEYDALYHSHTPQSLPLDPFFSLLFPLSYLLPDGMRYYFPALARFALMRNQKNQGCSDWTGQHLLYKMEDCVFRNSCNLEQKKVAASFLRHLQNTRIELIKEFFSEEEFLNLLKVWT